jgi:hypothetical protein
MTPRSTKLGADQHVSQRHQHDHQNDEGDGAQYVHHQRQHAVEFRHGMQLSLASKKQQYAQRQSDHHGKQQRAAQHQQGIDTSLAEFAPVVDIGKETLQHRKMGGDHRASSSTSMPASRNARSA